MPRRAACSNSFGRRKSAARPPLSPTKKRLPSGLLSSSATSAPRFPLAGYIAAGVPIEAVENRECLDIEDLFNSRSETFVLKVRGDSMIGEQIRDGDYVVCEKRSDPRRGETVVALLDSGEATLKKFYRQGGKIKLQPANPEFKPLFVDADKVQIQGVVLGVLRAY